MKLEIAVALRRTEKKWINKKVMWEVLVDKLSRTQRTNETFKEYITAPKKMQAQIKDVGGFVGGYLNGGKRTASTVRHRQIVTLDIDDCKMSMGEGLAELIMDKIPYELLIYSTHKHESTRPRLRVIFPLDRPVSPDEYEAIARYLAGEVNIDFFDPTTFQPERMMFWPSTSSDGEFFFEHSIFAPICSADEVLANYVDWKDISAWPRLSTEEPRIAQEMKTLGDPTEKEGIVGAFCRAYDCVEAIEKFLPNVYEEAFQGRYTYLDGSSAGGGITYNKGMFFYSHHGTDPAGQKLLNSFDLVRIHKYGGQDTDQELPMSKRESFKSMCDFVLRDKNVRAELDSVENPATQALYTDFAEEIVDDNWMDLPEDPDDLLRMDVEAIDVMGVPDFYKPDFRKDLGNGITSDNWREKLDLSKKGEIESKITNLKLILTFDEDLMGKIAMNDFEHSIYVMGSLPWNASKQMRRWEDADEAGLRELVEIKYNVYHVSKITDALVLSATYNRFHPIKHYLETVKWDGVPRLDTMFIDYLGAEDTPYTRQVTRKAWVAAVARIFRPGCKFDYVLTLVGDEGLKKSSILAQMGGRWFSDSFNTVEGTKAYEQLQGSWVIEIAELSAFNRSETNSIKAFVTKKHDKFRGAYQRNSLDWPRQCVFFATTNEMNFLKGNTGNRRFWPIKVYRRPPMSPVIQKSANGGETVVAMNADQMWAEAKHYFDKGEKLYLDDKMELLAKEQQEIFSEGDERLGIIERYLDIKLPVDWDSRGRYERRQYIEQGDYSQGVHQRDYVCILEIWEEALGQDRKECNNYKVRELVSLLRKMNGWEFREYRRSFGIYGPQRHFARKTVEEIFNLN